MREALEVRLKLKKKEFEEWDKTGKFIPVKVNIFMYHYTFHAVCSSVRLTQFRDSDVPISINHQAIDKCTEHKRKDQNCLLPFFCDDYGLEMMYLKRIDKQVHRCGILHISFI